MTRVVLLNLDEGVVTIRCMSENVPVSTIESLPAGGTRLVTASSEGAERIRRLLTKYLIVGDVKREGFRPATASPYATAIKQRSKR